MQPRVRPIGWFMRNLTRESPVAEFWRNVLGFPVMRRIGAAMEIFWAGEAIVIELAFSDGDVPPSDAPWGYMPIFRTEALADLILRLRKIGVHPAQESSGPVEKEAVFLDPSGHPVGFRERLPTASSGQDVEARRRGRRGEAFNPGCASMPRDIQELGWVRRRVHDVARMATFYSEVVGYKNIGQTEKLALFDLGDNVILELTGGGLAIEPPQDRKGSNEYIIHRVDDLHGYLANLSAQGVRIVNSSIPVYWGEIAYFADPEGYLIGLESARHPGTYAPEKPPLAEGLEAERRWRELLSSPAGGR